MAKQGSSLQMNGGSTPKTGAAKGLLAGRGARLLPLGLASVLALAACGEREVQLIGPREELRSVLSDQVPGDIPTVPENRALPISLPAVSSNAAWTQDVGTPSTRPANAALSPAPVLAWSTNIGDGDGRRVHITSAPIVADGRIFTLDATGHVSAVSPAGALLWQTSLVPAQDNVGEASGGGLAYGAGLLFVTTGFGELHAIDPASGGIVWTQKLLASSTGAPTVYGDLVYVTAGESEAWAINVKDGRIRWQITGTPSVNNFSGAPSPAVTDQFAIFGFGSGEVRTAYRQGGLGAWSTIVSGRRLGYARANVDDITGDPVVVGDTVYTGNISGRMVALELSTGTRKWTANEGPMGPAWVAGGSVFIVTDNNELVRLDATTGERIWGTQLPFFEVRKPRKQQAVFAHYGPILAGGRLVVASSDGVLRFFDPVSGAPAGQAALPDGAASAPVVAGGVLYVLSKKGQLLAYR